MPKRHSYSFSIEFGPRKAASEDGDSAMSSLLSKEAVDMLDKIVAILHFLASDDPKSGKWRFDSEFRRKFFELFVQPLPFHAAHQGRYSVMS